MNTFNKNTAAVYSDAPALSGDGQDAGFTSSTRQVEEFARAKRHTGLVRVLKIALPAIAVLIVLGIVAALVLRSISGPSIEIGNISIDDGKLVMQEPRLNGFDEKKRPFSVSAAKAIQNVENPARVALEMISAKLPVEDGVFATITAGNGLYDAEAKTLVLSEEVQVVTNNGMQLNLQDADMNIGTGMLRTENPIFAKSKEAEITSNSLLVENNGERVVFEGKVIMIVNPGELQDNNNEQN